MIECAASYIGLSTVLLTQPRLAVSEKVSSRQILASSFIVSANRLKAHWRSEGRDFGSSPSFLSDGADSESERI